MRKTLLSAFLRQSLVAGAVVWASPNIGHLRGAIVPGTLPVTIAVSTESPQAPAAVGFTQLINQLGSESFRERDLAEEQLIHLGRASVPALKEAARINTDPEIRSRATEALAELREQADTGVSLISLHVKDEPVQDVLDTIASQSYAQITSIAPGAITGVDTRRITVDADEKPFWEVMSDVCRQLNASAMPVYAAGKGGLQLISMTHNWMHAPHQIVGPFWIGVFNVLRGRSIDLMGTASTDDDLIVCLLVYPEPKLATAQISELHVLQATDDAGHSLTPVEQQNRPPGLPLSGIRTLLRHQDNTIISRLSYPNHPGTKIALLRGEIQVQVSGGVEQYIVDDVMGTQKVTNPLSTCTVTAACTRSADAPDMYLVTLQATRGGLNNNQWAALTSRANKATLDDADGLPLDQLNNAGDVTSNENTFETSFYFANVSGHHGKSVVDGDASRLKTGTPTKLTWNIATYLKTFKIPVTFKDLPMP